MAAPVLVKCGEDSPGECGKEAVRPCLKAVRLCPDGALVAPAGGRGPGSLLQRRMSSFRARMPALNVEMVVEEGSQKCPFSNSDCKSLSERFDVMEALGQGTTAVVYRARRKEGGEEVALKVLRTNEEELIGTAKTELELLRPVRHPNIIRAYDFFTFPKGAVLVLEFFAGKNLQVAVAQAPNRRLADAACRRLFAALLSAVGHLHSLNIIHRDVKASNVLVSDDLQELKLVDFNVATNALEGGALTLTGTADYLPPEVLRGEPHSPGSDVWAAGLCLHLMASGTKPLSRRVFPSHEAFAQAVVARAQEPLTGAAWEAVPDECKDTVRCCLEPQLELRPSASQVEAQPWLLAADK